MRFWKPTEGDQDIRIVPTEDGDPFKVYHFHYNLGEAARGGVLCPKRQFGEECPICDFASVSYGKKEPMIVRRWQSPSLFVNDFFSPVIVRGEEEAGVRKFGAMVKPFMKLCLDLFSILIMEILLMSIRGLIYL